MNNDDDSSTEAQPNDVNSISSIGNYKAIIEMDSIEIFAKYIDIVSKYITYFRNTANVRKNVEYYKYIFIKGINTICHVFKILLLYTKNIHLVLHHCEKSFFYYIEFIRQMDEDGHTLLKLNSTDASYFVFKKTIYEINDEHRKKFTQLNEDDDEECDSGHDSSDRLKITRTNKMIDIYNRLFVKVVHSTILEEQNSGNNSGNTNTNTNTNTNINININNDVVNEQLVCFKNKMDKSSVGFLHYLQGENDSEDRFLELLNVTEMFVFNYKNDNKCIAPYMDILLKKIKKKVGSKDNKLGNSSEILGQITKNIQMALFMMKHVEENDSSINNSMTPSKYISLLIK
jgi:hypothetical protein